MPEEDAVENAVINAGGEREALLRVKIEVDTERLLPRMERLMGLDRRSPWAPHLAKAVADAHKRLVGPSVSTDVRVQMKLAADRVSALVEAGTVEM